jgi:phage shock protein PspC (stress-responsive transcriptional regulator)
MKKVININFQGQVLPIEETAYEMLQNYVASLRTYFAQEEGREEIINDIESRIAELFGEALKKGAACITDAEVTRIMNSMGRPEDFAAADEGAATAAGNTADRQQSSNAGSSSGSAGAFPPFEHKRLYRDEQDKIIGGVASGLANYMNIDPSIVRIIFALLAIFGGSGILVYIVFWIVLPSRSLVTNIRKRLYRDPDDRVIAGVGGGLGKYFDINPAIPRLIFAAPFILGIISSVVGSIFNPFPVFIGSFGGGTLTLAYIILWIVLPVARTASEKLEMRGEKVDLNSIRNTIVNDLEGLKSKAMAAGTQIGATAKKIGAEVSQTVAEKGSQLGSDISSATRRSTPGIVRAIRILIKAFIYFILGILGFALFMGAIGLLVGGISIFPLHDFLLKGAWQHFCAWGTMILFLGVPMVALLVWLIRRMIGVKKSNPYIGYGFATLWIIGLVCFISLLATLNSSFSTQVAVRKEVAIQQPDNGNLTVKLAERDVIYYDNWININGLVSLTQDSIFLNTAKVNVVKSKDTAYHVYLMQLSRGSDNEQARKLAEKIDFKVSQENNSLILSPTFAVSRNDKWRNQKVIVVVEVPEGKTITLDESIDDYDYFYLQFTRRGINRGNWQDDWDENSRWMDKNTPLKMDNKGSLINPNKSSGNNAEEYRYENNQPAKAPEPGTTLPSKKPAGIKDKTTYRYSVLKKEQHELPMNAAIMAHPFSLMLRI